MVSPEAQDRFRAAAEAGVLKILSKIGIEHSRLVLAVPRSSSRRWALDGTVVDVCFAGTPSVVGGIGWATLGDDVLRLHAQAFRPTTSRST